MYSYPRLSIKHKLQLITMAAVVVALLLACAAFASYDVLVFRNSLRRDLETLAEIVASNSNAAVSFGDQAAAEELLQGLRAKQHLRVALIYSANDSLFASYTRPDIRPGPKLPSPQMDGSRFASDRLVIFHKITLGGRQIGNLYLESDLEEMHERLRRFAGIIAVVLLVGSLVALLLSSKLQRVISRPILHLARTAKRVSIEKDYSIRAIRQNEDEIGDLVDGFNDMLRQIQRHRDHLEEEVTLRTSELVVAKERAEAAAVDLQAEVRAKQEANARLAEAQQHLMELSRQAGMAEVATGVLHNVGNVLNSVNVSANIVAGKIRDSRVIRLKTISEMLREHSGRLPEFLIHDAKGQRVIPYLANLSSHLEEERHLILREVDLLTSHIGHIKEIVATQQSYAKVSGLVEVVPLAVLVEDALNILQPGIERQKIRVERDFEKIPAVAIDKHAVLQILLNLLRNAKQAIKEKNSDWPEPRIWVRICRWGEDRIRISVGDTGVGLPPENLTRIFSHGFTTRRDGHGFGLHSGANVARQMGGMLWAESDGLGLGATFTLELPLRADKRREEGNRTEFAMAVKAANQA